jgi:hypothetical protein
MDLGLSEQAVRLTVSSGGESSSQGAYLLSFFLSPFFLLYFSLKNERGA